MLLQMKQTFRAARLGPDTTQRRKNVSQEDIVRRAEDDQVWVGHRHRRKYAGLWNIDMLDILEV